MIHIQFLLNISVNTKSSVKLMGMKKLISLILPFKHFEHYVVTGEENLHFDTRSDCKPEKATLLNIIKPELP